MAANGKVKVGIIGSGFEADIHAASFQIMPEEAEVVAVASPTRGHPEALAKKYGIPRVFHDYREMLKDRDIEMVTINAPNDLHCAMTRDIAGAGKHVVCEKPLAMTLEEADEMIDVCKKQGVLLAYAEELLFTPKYVKAKANGGPGRVRQSVSGEAEREAFRAARRLVLGRGQDPAAACSWTWAATASRSATGFWAGRKSRASIARWGRMRTLTRPRAKTTASAFWNSRTARSALIEDSWAKPGGMDDCTEIYGTRGVTYADLHMGNALPTFSEPGYGYAVEKAPSTQGWTYPVFEEHWNYGLPQELRHFARCVRGKETLRSTGEDGRMVQEVLLAGYQSAGTGRKVEFPFRPKGVKKPIDLWWKPRD